MANPTAAVADNVMLSVGDSAQVDYPCDKAVLYQVRHTGKDAAGSDDTTTVFWNQTGAAITAAWAAGGSGLAPLLAGKSALVKSKAGMLSFKALASSGGAPIITVTPVRRFDLGS